jgi:hypothetical protein
MNPRLAFAVVLPLLLVAVPPVNAAAGHYLPHAGDRFDYYETIYLGSGSGNYSTYTESTYVNGTVGVTAVAANGTESATYSYSESWSNSSPGSLEHWTSSGPFTFSALTFEYVQGTDNESEYAHDPVWFYIDNSLGVGDTFTLLGTPMQVFSTNVSYALGAPYNEYVATIYAQGTGSYERNDVYGVFNAAYTWNAYFDPSTGYIVGYVYTETDSNGAGDGFSITDTLAVTSTTYPLTAGSVPATSSSGGLPTALVVGLVLVVVLVVIVVIWLAVRSRRRSSLPKHSARGNVSFGPTPGLPPSGIPPPINLTPAGQPAVQQVVIRETVKVNCRYCGTLIDSTATVCPNCGAPRT